MSLSKRIGFERPTFSINIDTMAKGQTMEVPHSLLAEAAIITSTFVYHGY